MNKLQRGSATPIIIAIIAVAMIGGVALYLNNSSNEVTADDSNNLADPGTYQNYNESKLALADSEKVILFFSADWCSTCRGLDRDINKKLGKIPSDINILKINYDRSRVLRQKYGVVIQHTLVQVDSNGDMIGKWIGSSSLERLVSRVK